jgi:hypothetical protein
MEPVDNVSKAMEILRRQMAENLDRLKRSGQLPSGAALKPAANAGASLTSTQEIVARKIRAIDPRSPDFDAQAGAVFIETVLTAEFGDTLLNSPAFQEMLGTVRHAMLADETIHAQLHSLLRAMRAG